jgi:hypothetical protein
LIFVSIRGIVAPHEFSLKDVPKERQVGGKAKYHQSRTLRLQEQVHQDA